MRESALLSDYRRESTARDVNHLVRPVASDCREAEHLLAVTDNKNLQLHTLDPDIKQIDENGKLTRPQTLRIAAAECMEVQLSDVPPLCGHVVDDQLTS
jgi:hypothetical protein